MIIKWTWVCNNDQLTLSEEPVELCFEIDALHHFKAVLDATSSVADDGRLVALEVALEFFSGACSNRRDLSSQHKYCHESRFQVCVCKT